MLARVWRKGNPLTLLVGMQTSTATMENPFTDEETDIDEDSFKVTHRPDRP